PDEQGVYPDFYSFGHGACFLFPQHFCVFLPSLLFCRQPDSNAIFQFPCVVLQKDPGQVPFFLRRSRPFVPMSSLPFVPLLFFPYPFVGRNRLKRQTSVILLLSFS